MKISPKLCTNPYTFEDGPLAGIQIVCGNCLTCKTVKEKIRAYLMLEQTKKD